MPVIALLGSSWSGVPRKEALNTSEKQFEEARQSGKKAVQAKPEIPVCISTVHNTGKMPFV